MCCGAETQLLELSSWPVQDTAPLQQLFAGSALSAPAYPRPSTTRRRADTRGSCRPSSAQKVASSTPRLPHTTHMSLCAVARRTPVSLSWVSRTRTAAAMPLRAKITNPAWMTGTRMVGQPICAAKDGPFMSDNPSTQHPPKTSQSPRRTTTRMMSYSPTTTACAASSSTDRRSSIR